MKKSFFAFAALAAILAGCAKEVDTNTHEEVAPEKKDAVVLRAAVPETDTKVSSDNAGAFKWQIGDKITVFNTDTTPVGYEFETVAGGTAVDFSSTTFEGTLSTLAMYPSSTNHTSTQYSLDATFAWSENASRMPMLGVVDPVKLTAEFSSAGSVLKLICFNVDADARKLVVTSDSKKINGLFTPTGTPEKIVAADKGDGDNTITITFGDDHLTNMVFYIPLPTGNVGVLTFTLKDDDGKELFEKATKAAITMSRNELLVAPVLNCGGPELILSESFTEFDEGTVAVASYAKGGQTVYSGSTITYSIGSNASTTIYKAQNTAKGAAAGELMLARQDKSSNNGTFIISGIPSGVTNNLVLSFVSNRNSTSCNTVTSGTTGITVSSRSVSGVSTPYTISYSISINTATAPSTFELTFTNSSSSDNARIDDITIMTTGAAYTAPSISGDNSLTIDIAAGNENTASTSISLANAVDNMGVGVVVAKLNNSDPDPTWLSAEVSDSNSPYTLTVRAPKNASGTDRSAKVIVRASGVKKEITVTQPNALVANPSFSVSEGTYNNTQSVSLSCSTDGASIRYTTDGTEPSSTEGTVYSSAITVSASQTIKAVAYKTNYKSSDLVSNTYTLKAAAPVFSVEEGTYGNNQSVTLSSTTEGASIRYTTDGTEPSATVGNVYTEAISVSSSQTIKAVAYKDGYTNSDVVSKTYTLKAAAPVFSVAEGTYGNDQSVTLSSTTEGASIRYTTDGTEPSNTVGTVYAGAISVSASQTIKAVAYKDGYTNSDVVSKAYTLKVATPSLNKTAGAIEKGAVDLSTTTTDATIYYTTTNDDYPSANWIAGNSVTVNSAQTVRVIAVKDGYTDSDIASAAYTIKKVATPTFSPTSGSAVKSGSKVTLSCETTGATIYYTTDGSTPTASSSVYNTTDKVSVTAAVTIKAIAVKDNWDDSEIASASYTIDASVAIYNETFGTTGSSTKIGSYTGWSDDTTSSIVSSDANTDIRTTNASSGYTGASGSCNAMINATTKWLQFTFGDISDYTGVKLSVGYRKGSGNGSANTLHLYISKDGGSTWDSTDYLVNTSGSAWYLKTIDIPDTHTSNFAIKFTSTGSNDNRVDDIKLVGTAK